MPWKLEFKICLSWSLVPLYIFIEKYSLVVIFGVCLSKKDSEQGYRVTGLPTRDETCGEPRIKEKGWIHSVKSSLKSHPLYRNIVCTLSVRWYIQDMYPMSKDLYMKGLLL